jgi:dolichol-phosphate mannosyltransferase
MVPICGACRCHDCAAHKWSERDHAIGNRLDQYEHDALTHLNLRDNFLMNTQFEWIHGVYMTDILSGYRAFTLLSIRQMNLKKTESETETGINSVVISRSLRFEIVPIFYKKTPWISDKTAFPHNGYEIFRAINRCGKMNNQLFHFSFIDVIMCVIWLCFWFYAFFLVFLGIEHLFIGVLIMHLVITGIIIFTIGFISVLIVGYHRELIRKMCIFAQNSIKLKKMNLFFFERKSTSLMFLWIDYVDYCAYIFFMFHPSWKNTLRFNRLFVCRT